MLQSNYPTPIPLGDTVSVPFAATNLDGTAYDLTGKVLTLFISDALPDGGVYILTKSTSDGGITVVGLPTAGLANINFLAADASLLRGRSYPYAVRDETSQQTLAAGVMTFADHPGR